MNRMNDQAYLRSNQYRSDANLNARIQLHELYSLNKLDFHQWVFDHLKLSDGCRILEVGCGPGMLWRKNIDRLSPTWQVCLSDFSPGMIRTARSHMLPDFSYFTASVFDIQYASFPDALFDVIIANHMLYHVPDINRALREIKRLLKPGGRVYAATNSRTSMQEMYDLVARFNAVYRNWRQGENALSFTLENGSDYLASHFPEIVLHRYEDGLEVTDAEPLADYINSSLKMPPPERQALITFLTEEMDRCNGTISITKETGLFEMQRRE